MPPILVADLDGTLSRTDTLHEAVLRLAATAPLKLVNLPRWVLQGRSRFKAHIADLCILSGDDLPLNEVVIETLAEARAAGRRTALVSAADQRQVDAVAETVGLFDEVHGSRPEHNLKGSNKAQFLIERYGDRGFAYIGDHPADIPVWRAAARALTVGASPKLRHAAEGANAQVAHLDPPKPKGPALWAALSIRQAASSRLPNARHRAARLSCPVGSTASRRP